MRRGQLGDRDLSSSAAGPKIPVAIAALGTHHCWDGTGSALCTEEEDVTPNQHRVQPAPRCWSPFPPGAQQGVRQLGGLRAEAGQRETIQGCPRQSHHKPFLIHPETRGAPVHPSQAPALPERDGGHSLRTGETENVCLISTETPSSNCLQLLQK